MTLKELRRLLAKKPFDISALKPKPPLEPATLKRKTNNGYDIGIGLPVPHKYDQAAEEIHILSTYMSIAKELRQNYGNEVYLFVQEADSAYQAPLTVLLKEQVRYLQLPGRNGDGKYSVFPVEVFEEVFL